ncbi:hypothetical protein [Flagellimonas sp. CMM7]|uniref:hypothetical protein n=1 Tax=Flagellimonas sp. CMM7 TaxID=2654676 RepID=UPI0013D1B9E3|nr:hypothetical protein [Flagellimonas sp. CMM7]UII80005.1 hypothetical protein LV704_00440 [Flagellimonas sp. CMM7]
MIDIILDLLAMDDWYNVSSEIEIAKGKNKLPTSIKEGVQQAKRKAKWSQKY